MLNSHKRAHTRALPGCSFHRKRVHVAALLRVAPDRLLIRWQVDQMVQYSRARWLSDPISSHVQTLSAFPYLR